MDGPASDASSPAPGARRGVRRGLLVAIAALYVASVPWYRDADAGLRVWLGLPDWVAVAVLCYAAVAVLNSIAWRLTDIDDDGPLPPSVGPGDAADERRGGR